MSSPSSQLTRSRWLHRLATATFAVMSVLWIVALVLWLIFIGFIVPQLDRWKPQLEQRLSQTFERSVRIGALKAARHGLQVHVRIEEVNIDQVLHLKDLWVDVSPVSLLQFKVEQWGIDQPTLTLRRDSTGRISIGQWRLPQTQAKPTVLMDALFSQASLRVRGGHFTVVDTKYAPAGITFTQVDATLQNGLRSHDFQIDATPPPDLGERLSLRGRFNQAFFTRHASDTATWSGTLYAHWPKIQSAGLSKHGAALWQSLTADLKPRLTNLQGTVQIWAQMAQGHQWEALDAKLTGGSAGAVQALARYLPGTPHREAKGHLMLRSVALPVILPWLQALGNKHLPTLSPAPWSQLLLNGTLTQLNATWVQTPQWQIQASGEINNVHAQLGDDGIKGLNGRFVVSQKSGKMTGSAQLQIPEGAAYLGSVFEVAQVPLTTSQAHIQWQRDAAGWQIQLPTFELNNQDASVQGKFVWKNERRSLLPSPQFDQTFELSGTVPSAQLTAIARYLPKKLSPSLRNYFSQALQGGQAQQVQFHVQGDPAQLWDTGIFKIAGHLQQAKYDYIPTPPSAQSSMNAAQNAWPSLTNLSGQFAFHGRRFELTQANAQLAGHDKLYLVNSAAHIADWRTPEIGMKLQGQTELNALVHLIQNSALNALTQSALGRTLATGLAPFELDLQIPLQNVQRSKVNGKVLFKGQTDSAVRWHPALPWLTHVNGELSFSEKGFNLRNLSGQALGGPVTIQGGMNDSKTDQLQLQLQGLLTAKGLSDWPGAQTASLEGLLERISGEAAYSAQVRTTAKGLDVRLSSDLVGLGLDFPAPVQKAKATQQSLQVAWQDNQFLNIQWGKVATLLADYSQSPPRMALNVGAAAALELPEKGFAVALDLPTLSIAAWRQILTSRSTTATATATATKPQSAADTLAPVSLPMPMPTVVLLKIDDLYFAGRHFHNLVAGASQQMGIWRVNVDAKDLDGYLEYRPGQGKAQLFGRLAKLRIPPEQTQQVEALLDVSSENVPALDFVVEDLEWAGKKLGRLDVQAVHEISTTQLEGKPMNQWRLQQLDLTLPDGKFTSNGLWGGNPKRTTLQAQLEIHNAGQFLQRLEYPGLLLAGQGQLQAKVAWLGAPWALDLPTLTGQIRLDMGKGQFLKVDPGVGRLLNVLSLQALPRLFSLDFRDVFGQGFAFDTVTGDAVVQEGVARTDNFQMKGVLATAQLNGSADLAKETQSLRVLVTPDINAGGASLLATLVNPVVGVASFITQWVLRRPINQAGTKRYSIEGTWSNPVVTPFELPKDEKQ